MKGSPSLLLAAMLSLPVVAHAAEPEQCKTVNFSDVGWTDITVTTATTSEILKGLGYKPRTTMISVPVTYKSLADGKNMDIFLGNWMPTMENDIKQYRDAGTVETVRANLENAKYTLAVPEALYEKGLKDFADIAKFKDELGGKIYGIEPGSGANTQIKDMIARNRFGLGDFQLVESSEAGMLSAVTRAVKRNEAIVFFGWAPHPMNVNVAMTYLTGSDDALGPNEGMATVWSVTSPTYAEQCPNVHKLLTNLTFTAADESRMMQPLLDHKDALESARQWLKEHPQDQARWLEGVTTFDGKPAAANLQLTRQ